MTFSRFAATTALLSTLPMLGALAGCAATTDLAEDDATSTSAEALSTKKAVLGKWDADTGVIYALELTSDYAETLGGGLKGRRFEATVDNGIRCFTVPCPSTDKVSGVYALKGNTLTLASYDRPTAAFAKILGEYRFHVTAKSLTLQKCDDAAASSAFHRAVETPAPAACGTIVCGEGTVCCNPLTNTCVKPGMMCAF